MITPEEARERARLIPQRMNLHVAGRSYCEPSHADGTLRYTHAVYHHQPGKLREIFAVAEGDTADEAHRRAMLIFKNCEGGEA